MPNTLNLALPTTFDSTTWIARWDAQQAGYLPDREERFTAMLDVLEVVLPPNFVAVDLCCGPGSLSRRLLSRFPQARVLAVDLDPVLLALGHVVRKGRRSEGRLYMNGSVVVPILNTLLAEMGVCYPPSYQARCSCACFPRRCSSPSPILGLFFL